MSEDIFGLIDEGDVKSIRELIQNGQLDLNQKNGVGHTPLLQAVSGFKYEIAVLFMNAQDNISDLNNALESVFLLDGYKDGLEYNGACMFFIEALMSRGANLNEVEKKPLIEGFSHENSDIVNKFLDSFNVTKEDFIYAVGNNKNALVKGYIERLDNNKFLQKMIGRGSEWDNVQDYAEKFDGFWKKIAEIRKDKSLILESGKIFGDVGNDLGIDILNMTNSTGFTPLSFLINKRELELAGHLIQDYEVDLDKTLNGNWTALKYACEYNNIDAARLLIDAGADVDKSSGGRTPLIIAAEKGSTEILELLLEGGANSYISYKKKNAFDYANNAEIKNLISEYQERSSDGMSDVEQVDLDNVSEWIDNWIQKPDEKSESSVLSDISSDENIDEVSSFTSESSTLSYVSDDGEKVDIEEIDMEVIASAATVVALTAETLALHNQSIAAIKAPEIGGRG